MWGATEWMIKKKKHRDTQTSPLISALKSASQVSSVWEMSFEKLVRDGERGSDWLRLLSDYEQEQCATDKQALTSQNWKSKMLNVWKSFFFFLINKTSLPLIGIESMCFQHVYRHRQPTTICTFYLLHSVLLCTSAPIEALLLSKRRYAKQLILFFSFVSFCVGPIWPLSCTRCAFPWSRSPSTLPFIFTPLPPAMNDSLGEAPFLHQKALQLYTIAQPPFLWSHYVV